MLSVVTEWSDQWGQNFTREELWYKLPCDESVNPLIQIVYSAWRAVNFFVFSPGWKSSSRTLKVPKFHWIWQGVCQFILLLLIHKSPINVGVSVRAFSCFFFLLLKSWEFVYPPGGFLFTMFPDKEPGRGPPLKNHPQNWSILGAVSPRGFLFLPVLYQET